MTEFQQLRQGNLTVSDYIAKFEALSRFAPWIATDNKEKINHFTRGLKSAISTGVCMARPKDFSDVIELSLIAEKGIQKTEAEAKWTGIPWSNLGWQHPIGKGKQVQGQQIEANKRQRTSQTPAREFPKCPKCGKSHLGECRFGSGNCYRCGKPGHLIKNCPQPLEKKATQGRVFTMTVEEAESDPMVVAGNIFISGLIAHSLVDSGSTHSFASVKFAQKLGITPEHLENLHKYWALHQNI